MNNIGKNYFDVGYIDALARGRSPLHRLDPRVKLITTLLFIVTVVSFGKYTLWAFIPFVIYPVFLISAGGLPAGYFVKKALLVLPFAVLIGVFNPVIDRTIMARIGMIGISGGWISFLSILVRCALTVTAAMLLIALTGFDAVCEALTKLGVPRPFVVQLLFFYRYLFVLTDEAQRMERARTLRSSHAGVRLKVFCSMAGQLLLRTFDRAERIYSAMSCRGFNGNIRTIKTIRVRWGDIGFMAGWGLLFVVFRVYNIPVKLGELILGCLR
ncbi:MAG TPA: cobalt ECF transporter T component CbiQ [Candidatus Omnitrophota bacterium]|nr:cobalt ECF transporter T component CbiQ [Candidatus Omnitrophota bacterium]